MKIGQIRKKTTDQKRIKKDLLRIGEDIIHSDRFHKAAAVPHHKESNIAAHSLETASYALTLTRWLNRHGFSVNEADAVRAALLHDIGMTEDKIYESPSYRKAFSHPKAGLRIAREEFQANDRQIDAIRRHMWPICIIPPRSVAGWVVLAADKYCSYRERQRQIRV